MSPEYRGWPRRMQPSRLDRVGRRIPCRGVTAAKIARDFEDVHGCQDPPQKPALKVLLCSPRGFCAGVVRAIDSVERALALYGPPVYVRHEIVHNRYVVEGLRAKGAIFVEELDEVPDTGAPVIFSAHGVPRSGPEEAARRNLFALDATCPLVTKVHREAEIHHRRGREIVLIGHAGHPEVIGTMGQLPAGAVSLVETLADAASFAPRDAHAARLRDADHAVGGRHRRNRRRC